MNGGETTVTMADETTYLFTVSKDDVAMPRVQMGTLAACMLVYVPMRVPLVSHFCESPPFSSAGSVALPKTRSG